MRLPRVPSVLRGPGVVAALALAGVAAAAAPAQAGGVYVQVTPSSITAGYQLTIKASCGDNTNDAEVRSAAFGAVTVHPYNGVLTAQVTVPSSQAAGGYDVTLTCRTGSSATTTLWVLNSTSSSGGSTGETYYPSKYGPHTGGGFLAVGGQDTSTAARLWLAAGGAALVAGLGVAMYALRRRVPARGR